MTAQPVASTYNVGQPVALRYALASINGGYDIALATVTAMLDNGSGGARARVLAPGEPFPYGAAPVLVGETSLFSARRLEGLLQVWGPRPRPWLVWVADAPIRPVQDARFLIRALEGRLAGVARVPYLPVLRAVEGPDEALEYRDVQAAGEKLRRTIEGN
ncbi:hypothetical protein [Streptomyces sp. NPDC020983]|uniref:hypothetical protein n=1 Tax=Streptomyces sp. NPDC020983 TaxID=3365106 RepID=UPI003798BD2C